MGRLVWFIVAIIIAVAKYFIYKHFDTKKIAEEVEKSKTVWVPEFKDQYLKSCINPPGGTVDPTIDMSIYCNCVAEAAQKAAAFPTAYNADEMTADQYQAELERLSAAYFDSESGKQSTDQCAQLAVKTN